MTTHTGAASRPGTSSGEADPRRWIALAIVLTAAFMQLVDISIVNVAIPSVQRNLDATYSQVQWVLAGYQLAFAVTLITGGRLGDIFGRKRMFILGMAGFTLASALCGLAQSPGMLIASRVLQGLMGAIMFPQVLSVIQVSFPPRERATALGIFGATIGVATIAGPLVGGLLIQANLLGLDWRPIFLVNVPIGIASLTAAAFLLRESRSADARRLDLGGVALVTAGLLLLVYPLVQGRELGWPRWTFLSMAASVPVLALFALYERRKKRRDGSPLVDLDLFRQRPFVSGLLLSLIFFMGISAFFLTFTIYLQIGLGFTALHAGLTTVPFAIFSAIASGASVRLAPRLGTRVLHLGTLLLTSGMGAVILTIHRCRRLDRRRDHRGDLLRPARKPRRHGVGRGRPAAPRRPPGGRGARRRARGRGLVLPPLLPRPLGVARSLGDPAKLRPVAPAGRRAGRPARRRGRAGGRRRGPQAGLLRGDPAHPAVRGGGVRGQLPARVHPPEGARRSAPAAGRDGRRLTPASRARAGCRTRRLRSTPEARVSAW